MAARAKLIVTGTLLLGATAALAQSGTGDPAVNWERIAACARLDKAAERHACLDGVLRATGLLDPEREVAEQRESFGEQRRERRQPAPPPAPSVRAPSPAPVAPAAPPAPLEQIATTVSRAFDPGNRLMVIVTQDGQVWQQNESKDLGLPPRPGTRFTIEKGTLGSFICRIGSGRSFRCRRHD